MAADAGYEVDFYAWTMEQAKLIRDGAFETLDRDNLAEEIESWGREQFAKLESAFRVLLMHMLKWDYQPARRTRSWALTIAEQRLRVGNVLSDNPSLVARREDAAARAYRLARIGAARETGLDLASFPEANPYAFGDMTDRPFEI
ncbi:MAG: DUF29 domain-containing protein [Xanthobacteraceae bacterium]